MVVGEGVAVGDSVGDGDGDGVGDPVGMVVGVSGGVRVGSGTAWEGKALPEVGVVDIVLPGKKLAGKAVEVLGVGETAWPGFEPEREQAGIRSRITSR
jgi:hypothetical protein